MNRDQIIETLIMLPRSITGQPHELFGRAAVLAESRELVRPLPKSCRRVEL